MWQMNLLYYVHELCEHLPLQTYPATREIFILSSPNVIWKVLSEIFPNKDIHVIGFLSLI